MNLKFHHIWIISFTTIGIILSILWGDTLLGFVAFISGIFSVLLAARGNRHTYSIGIINCITYTIVAYTSGLFGEVMLNIMFYLPLQFIGFYLWTNHTTKTTVIKKKLKSRDSLLIIGISIATTIIYGLFLSTLAGQSVPYIDSFTTIFSIVAAILMLLRFREFWLLYILVNIVSVTMWSICFTQGTPDAMLMIIMWTAYLINSIYGTIVWYNYENRFNIG